MAVNIFVSYSHKDKLARERLHTHLAPLIREGVEVWFDDQIPAGGELDPEIRRALKKADIFVALASPDYVRSEYCFTTEYGYAMRRAKRKRMYVIAAIIRPCGWKHTRMGRYKALPNDGKATTQWANRDLAYEDIVEGLRRIVTVAKAEASSKAVTKPARKPVVPIKKPRGSGGGPKTGTPRRSSQVTSVTPKLAQGRAAPRAKSSKV